MITFAPFCHFAGGDVEAIVIPGAPNVTVTTGIYSWGFDGLPGELLIETLAPRALGTLDSREFPVTPAKLPPGWYYIGVSLNATGVLSTTGFNSSYSHPVMGVADATTTYTPYFGCTLPYTYDGDMPQSPSGTYTPLEYGFPWMLKVSV